MSVRQDREARREYERTVALFMLPVLLYMVAGFYLYSMSPNNMTILGIVLATLLIAIVVAAIPSIALAKDIAKRKRRLLVATETLNSLSHYDFERYVAGLFEARGFTAQVVGGRGDGGIDIRVAKNGHEALVQCKHYSDTVGVKHVREFDAVIANSQTKLGYLVTSNWFSPDAKRWAKGKRLELIDRDRLAEWVEVAKSSRPIAPTKIIMTSVAWGIVLIAFLSASGLLVGALAMVGNVR